MTSKNRRNYYRLLHVQPDAPIEVIKAGYRTLMLKLKCHPDLGGSGGNAALLNEAYAVLSSPERREIYDREQGFKKSVGAPARARAKTGSSTPVPTPAKPAPTPSAPSERPGPADSHVCEFCKSPNSLSSQGIEAVCRGCGGPLRLIDYPASHSRERGARRIEYETDIQYQVDPSRPGSMPGRVVDLSPTGLLFSCPQSLTLGGVIKIDGPTLSAVARVTRVTSEDTTPLFFIGVRFLTLRLARLQGTFVSESA